MKNANTLALAISLLISASAAHADDPKKIDDSHANRIIEKKSQAENQELEAIFDLGWDSKYISEGRDNLSNGGIYWATAAIQKDNFNIYATVGRGDSEHYTEWNFGIDYSFNLSEHLVGNVGYQRLEFYGNERANDNELFSSIEYTQFDWLVPSLSYTYSTEAAGYFVEFTVHSDWALTESFTISPYITQGFDFQYVTEEHNGANHLQFGIEAEYVLINHWVLSGHISHSIAQEDIKLEARENGNSSGLDETYAGMHLSWSF